MKPVIRGFIQARMSSSRYPGKVLAPFRGEAMIRHVVRAVEEALSSEDVIVVTSVESSDDPLVRYIESLDRHVYRGPLDNVLARFVASAQEYPCDWIMRINGDSPLLAPELIRLVVSHVNQGVPDVVTTIFPRSFPKRAECGTHQGQCAAVDRYGRYHSGRPGACHPILLSTPGPISDCECGIRRSEVRGSQSGCGYDRRSVSA